MYQHWLTSPGRLEWVKNAPKKGKGGCIFCRIAKGDKKIPSRVLYRNENFLVIMNIFPYNTGHLQVLPVKHVINLEDMEERQVSGMFVLVKKCMKLLKKVVQPEGFNVGFNQGGDVAGASIEHLHVHIVPRFRRDFGFMDVISGTKVLPESINDTYRGLKKHIKILE